MTSRRVNCDSALLGVFRIRFRLGVRWCLPKWPTTSLATIWRRTALTAGSRGRNLSPSAQTTSRQTRLNRTVCAFGRVGSLESCPRTSNRWVTLTVACRPRAAIGDRRLAGTLTQASQRREETWFVFEMFKRTPTRHSRVARVYAGLALVTALTACASHSWETMPAGFRTQAAMLPSAGSAASGLFMIATEGSGELGTSVRFSGLEPRQRYILRIRTRPTCTVEGGPDSEFLEAPRTRPPNTPGHEYESFLERFPVLVADEHGDAIANARITGYLGTDWSRLSAVLYRGDVEPVSGSRVACGRFGTLKIEANL